MRLSVANRGEVQFWLFPSESGWKRIFTQVTLTSEVVQQPISLVLEIDESKVGARASVGSRRLKSLVLRGFSGTTKV